LRIASNSSVPRAMCSAAVSGLSSLSSVSRLLALVAHDDSGSSIVIRRYSAP